MRRRTVLSLLLVLLHTLPIVGQVSSQNSSSRFSEDVSQLEKID
jgi:hypothetical protein